MKERPILFSGPMVRAILNDSKTQTRRIAKRNESGMVKKPGSNKNWHVYDPDAIQACPFGVPGDRLWVRESFIYEPDEYEWEVSTSVPVRDRFIAYRADCPAGLACMTGRWSPSIHMPRHLSRIDLEITDVRLEWLQSISECDARAEGALCVDELSGREVLSPQTENAGSFKFGFQCVWEGLHGATSWAANPIVWAIEFRRINVARPRSPGRSAVPVWQGTGLRVNDTVDIRRSARYDGVN